MRGFVLFSVRVLKSGGRLELVTRNRIERRHLRPPRHSMPQQRPALPRLREDALLHRGI